MKWLIIYARRRVVSQAVFEARENTGMEEVTRTGVLGHLGKLLSVQTWGHSRMSQSLLEDSVVPGLVTTHYSKNPFSLQHATFKGKKVITSIPYPRNSFGSVSKAKALLLPTLRP